ncbi:hypothetical protein HJFPF1_00198 [Paramyrothecium foliicola]|nr:hypothetical protein HJFPF1_00198 [Paramyrothecium foliicola]
MVFIEGSCLCGAVRINSTGEPKARVLCHCLDCRKITGSLFSTNVLMPGDGFSVVQGTPKEFAMTADSGKTITSYFCGDCGCTLWRQTESYGDAKIVKAGTLDTPDALDSIAKPASELFTKNRISWLPTVTTEMHEAA